jgi:dipeptidyl aminopeptidase/acylaminoacyl peptidase
MAIVNRLDNRPVQAPGFVHMKAFPFRAPMPRHLVIALLAAATVVTRAAHAQPFTLDDYAKIFRVTDVQLAPQGDRAVVVLAKPNYDTNVWESELVQVDLRTRAQVTLTQRKTASTPRWSPDGDRLAFLAVVDGKTQLFVLNATGGDARQITRSPTSVTGYAWKPDGSAFAIQAAEAPPTRSKFDDAFEVNGNDYLTLSAPRQTRLWLVSAAGGDATPLGRGSWSIPTLAPTISWSADGNRILFTKQNSAGTREWERRELAVLDVTNAATATPQPLPGTEGRRCGSGWISPNGANVALVCRVDGHEKNQTELVTMPATGGAARRLTQQIDRNFAYAIWRRDSKGVVAAVPDGTTSALWEIPLDGAPVRRDAGRLGVNDLAVASDGTIALIGTDAHRPAELYVLRPGSSTPERLTDFHAAVATLTLGKVEAISWKSDDGLPLDGIVTFPPNFDATRTYPLLLHIHGGPWASSRETFSTRSQLLAAKGFIIFEPNYRGSDNHGNALYSAVYRDHGAGPGRDVMAGLAILKKRAYVDTTRIGVSGWSYGGYMTTWLIGHYTGWKAAMAGAAVIDLVDDYHLNDLSLFIRAYGETLTFPKDVALMKEQSPGSYVDKMTTPLLLLSTTGDVRVPVTQSSKLYNALKERGRDVRMRLWPVAGHFPADPWRARDVDREWAAYFEERLR